MIPSLKLSFTTIALALLVVAFILSLVEESNSCGGGGGGGCGFKGKGWKEDKGWKGDKGKGKGDKGKGKGKAKGCWKEDKGKGKCCKPKGSCSSCDDDDDDDDCGGMYKEKMYKEKMWKEKSLDKGKKCCKAVASKLIAKAKKLGDDEEETSYVYAPSRAPIRYQYLPAVESPRVRYVEAPVERRRHQVVDEYGDDYENELHRVRPAPRYVDEPFVRAAPKSREFYDYPKVARYRDHRLTRESDEYSSPPVSRFRDTATARGRVYPESDYLIYRN